MNDRKTVVPYVYLLILLVTCNVLFIHTSGRLHIMLNVLGIAGLYAIYKAANLTPEDVGTQRSKIKIGLKYGIISALVISCCLTLIYTLNPHTFRDPRYHQSLQDAYFSALFSEPLKTVVFEELAFRGLLLALLLRAVKKTWVAIIISSAAFGLWHTLSSEAIGNYHVKSVVVSQPIVIFAVIAFTTTAGVLLCLLRLRSKSLVSPIIVHWAVDSMAIIFAAYSWR